MSGLSTKARVRVMIEMDSGTWGPECTTEQVFRQASENVKGRIRNAFKSSEVRLIGDPVVMAVTSERE